MKQHESNINSPVNDTENKIVKCIEKCTSHGSIIDLKNIKLNIMNFEQVWNLLEKHQTFCSVEFDGKDFTKLEIARIYSIAFHNKHIINIKIDNISKTVQKEIEEIQRSQMVNSGAEKKDYYLTELFLDVLGEVGNAISNIFKEIPTVLKKNQKTFTEERNTILANFKEKGEKISQEEINKILPWLTDTELAQLSEKFMLDLSKTNKLTECVKEKESNIFELEVVSIGDNEDQADDQN